MLLPARCERVATSLNRIVSVDTLPTLSSLYKPVDGLALKQIDISVPVAVVQGHKAVLKCTFDLEGDKLYSMKWYRGAGEFYRYTPSDPKPIKQFKIRGFHVLESESNATQVVLENVSRVISGPFSCEVTADQPSFFTDMKTADLEVEIKIQK
ncbi:hypothetical protein NQ318_006942 [Aromia moschata]|uniref:Ig-like domain-containing protein n=1 Tax=Aromia moschata TaxID=1265417 RepID=A0AAV8YL53_9CUCU|nr:hypothetical protein NQ318_006942 [Aromia moschata]